MRTILTAMRAAIYVRISDDREGAGLGVKRQEDDCRSLADRLGWDVVDVYPDNDISAYSGKPRPHYERLLGDVRAGHIGAIIAWHPDRLHRSPRELEDFIDLIEARRVGVQTVKAGEYDLSTPSGRAVARTLGAWARYESEHKAERIKDKHIELASRGKSTGGGHRPYGYRRIYDREERPRKILREEIVPEEATVIRRAARRILAGEALVAVARDLNARGVPTVTGAKWSTTTLARLLSSARIAGQREHRPRSRGDTRRVVIGEIIGKKAAWPRIITPGQSARLRAMLADPARRTSPGPTGRHLCASGVLYCSRCDQRMIGRAKGPEKRMYMCDGSPGRPGCGKTFIDGDGVDEIVTGWVAGALSDPDYRAALEQRETGPDDAELLGEIATAEQELEELAADHGNKRITRREWLAARAPIQERIEQARRQLARADTARVLDGVPEGTGDLQAFLLDGTVEVSRRRAVVHVVLDRVIVESAVRGRRRFDADRLTPVWRV